MVCLGALDGTYIDVHMAAEDKASYRTREGSIAVNVLSVCDREMRFIYVLASSEGSAIDSRVLRDAISQPTSLKIPRASDTTDDGNIDYLGTVDSNPVWNTWRDEIPKSMNN
ncbi:UNVERIFIED_CONTAM: hypothetical protein Slati_2166400 [Sesamum latifolium]|uniref:Transposase n=1 Tax=Sesamum latifolium TaxID=2727402 RepID=A0AAW2WV81_9LAMI